LEVIGKMLLALNGDDGVYDSYFWNGFIIVCFLFFLMHFIDERDSEQNGAD